MCPTVSLPPILCTHAHARTHTRTYIHTHTHTHTHTQVNLWKSIKITGKYSVYNYMCINNCFNQHHCISITTSDHLFVRSFVGLQSVVCSSVSMSDAFLFICFGPLTSMAGVGMWILSSDILGPHKTCHYLQSIIRAIYYTQELCFPQQPILHNYVLYIPRAYWQTRAHQVFN